MPSEKDPRRSGTVSSHYWRPRDIELLRTRYFELGARGVATLLGRTERAIYARACQIGVAGDRTATRRRAR